MDSGFVVLAYLINICIINIKSKINSTHLMGEAEIVGTFKRELGDYT